MTTNTIVVDAVKATNESKQAQVVAEAQGLIARIQGEQSAIVVCETRIADLRKSVAKIADGSITLAKVMGNVELPSDGNPNTATILKAIEEANKKSQETVKIQSTNLVNDIDREQNNINSCNTRIAELREKLLKLGVSSVTVSSVMGS